jgi:hypothetical protein
LEDIHPFHSYAILSTDTILPPSKNIQWRKKSQFKTSYAHIPKRHIPTPKKLFVDPRSLSIESEGLSLGYPFLNAFANALPQVAPSTSPLHPFPLNLNLNARVTKVLTSLRGLHHISLPAQHALALPSLLLLLLLLRHALLLYLSLPAALSRHDQDLKGVDS